MLIASINSKCLPGVTFLIQPNNPIKQVFFSPFSREGEVSIREIQQLAESGPGIQTEVCLPLKLTFQMTPT